MIQRDPTCSVYLDVGDFFWRPREDNSFWHWKNHFWIRREKIFAGPLYFLFGWTDVGAAFELKFFYLDETFCWQKIFFWRHFFNHFLGCWRQHEDNSFFDGAKTFFEFDEKTFLLGHFFVNFGGKIFVWRGNRQF